ncbi:uncharacterized protein [Ptychodera flava]|uniref:uncharacterized protein n=1 Tax=Ptychodera flava TaxID=63121 RepID=UPI00396A424D
MLTEKSGEKDYKSSEDKTTTEKMTESLVTILFVFASWITGQYNLPGLNGNIATYFCAQQNIATETSNICGTVIDVKVSEDQKESAESVGITLIPARRKSSLDPQRHPPKLDWLLHHDIYYPSLGDLENVKYVVGHDSLTAEAAKDIRDSLFPDAELHLLKVHLPGVLVMFDKWDVNKYGQPELHRNVLTWISSRTGKDLKVYATVLDVYVTEAQRQDAEKAGITLIPARRAEHLDPEDDPINIRWLSFPDDYYPRLKDLPNIQNVIVKHTVN